MGQGPGTVNRWYSFPRGALYKAVARVWGNQQEMGKQPKVSVAEGQHPSPTALSEGVRTSLPNSISSPCPAEAIQEVSLPELHPGGRGKVERHKQINREDPA